MCAKITFNSDMAKGCPTQFRGPTEKGMKEESCLPFFVRKRSGAKSSPTDRPVKDGNV
eukprot:CAMPEP_0194154356 /NCGR_PEP_ID=MMETSP0152-20130528/60341_1 /TAXON_ID=1049557 /ORGANISM="Thalassiothrix antarctica, Strain L6-D1" /LENGTH=57 /DNA_ID=CAMNT_0038860397 /DNA_START=21 /DNA_END=194 /DNA_ORIENTATION=+